MKRYLLLACCFLLLLKFLSIRVIELRFSRLCPIVQTTDAVSAKEVDLFLNQWSEYVKRGYMAKIPEDFSFDNQNASERVPFIVKLWFDKNCIDPKRFFYVEQRLRTILKAYELQRHTQRVIDVLSSQITPDMNEAKKQWYQNLIEEQKQMSKIEGISQKEIAIIEGRDAQVREILR